LSNETKKEKNGAGEFASDHDSAFFPKIPFRLLFFVAKANLSSRDGSSSDDRESRVGSHTFMTTSVRNCEHFDHALIRTTKKKKRKGFKELHFRFSRQGSLPSRGGWMGLLQVEPNTAVHDGPGGTARGEEGGRRRKRSQQTPSKTRSGHGKKSQPLAKRALQRKEASR
jgi:hypothetical protein